MRQRGLISLLFDDLIRKSFKRLPTVTEWTRLQKYARRMRKLKEHCTQNSPSPEVFSVIQLRTINEPLFPNLKALCLRGIERWSIPLVPLFLSPRTTSVKLDFANNLPEAVVASTVTVLPALCPNLQAINLGYAPGGPTITAVVSRMLLVTYRNTLQVFQIDFLLAGEANEVLYKLPNLRILWVVIDQKTSLPPVSLPNLTELAITLHNEDGWPRLFRGATLGKLESVTFITPEFNIIGDFLGEFEEAVLPSSVQNTLSTFYLLSTWSWDIEYSSLLPFTQMVCLDIECPCEGECSSTVDDDIIISLSQAMPKLKNLGLCDDPCSQSTSGVTTKGLLSLARHCPNLSFLRIHFQVDSLNVPTAIPGMIPNAEPAAPSTEFVVGETSVPEGSALTIGQTLLQIFPRIDCTGFANDGWDEVRKAIQ